MEEDNERRRGRIHTRTSPSLHFFVFILSIFFLEYLNCNEYTIYFIYFRYKYIHKSWIMFNNEKRRDPRKKQVPMPYRQTHTEWKQDNRADNLAKHNFYRLLPTGTVSSQKMSMGIDKSWQDGTPILDTFLEKPTKTNQQQQGY